MADNKPVSLAGSMMALALVALLTVGGVTGLAVATWPKASADEGGKQNEVLAKAVAKLAVKGFLDYEDQMERQFYFDKMVKDIKADFPEIKDVWVLDDKRMVVYSPKEEEIEKAYQLPAGISQEAGEKFQVQPLSSGQLWVAAPVISAKTIIGGLRMVLEVPPAASGAGGPGLLLIVGLAALAVGIVAPLALLSGKSKQLASYKTGAGAAGAVSDAKLNSLKSEEAAVSAKLEAARQQLAQAEQAKAQLSAAEQQIEDMKKQQFEETYRLENLKKEAAELADHIDKRKKILEANPLERQAALSSEDQELVTKIAAHKQEEIKLAQKIELIRKKVVDLDRRIEKRQKEEQEIAERIEARKKEEMDLNLKMGS